MISDQCRSSMGRRKPFILGGAIAVSVSLLSFAFSESIVHGLLWLFGLHLSNIQTQRLVMANAVLWFCSLHISIQPLQVASRAFIIENCAADEQVLAHAWASRVQGLGNISGFFLASMPLSQIWPFGGLPQFSTLCLLACSLLLATVCITCFLVEGEQPRFHPAIELQRTTSIGKLKHILMSAKRMPWPVRKICLVQCFAWMGWFPFLMYYTT